MITLAALARALGLEAEALSLERRVRDAWLLDEFYDEDEHHRPKHVH